MDIGGFAIGMRHQGAAARVAALEADRRAAGIPQVDLAREAGISESTYRRLTSGGDSLDLTGQKLSAWGPRLDRLQRALARLAGRREAEPASADLIVATHRSFVLALAPRFGVTAEQVVAADPRANLNFDPTWRACRHVAQAALYLTNTALGIKQRRLADVLGLTPAAVCLALKAVEDRRDDAEFDAWLTAAARLITGRDE